MDKCLEKLCQKCSTTSYNVDLSQAVESDPTVINILTGKNSSYVSSYSSVNSSKGLKVDNLINISGGEVTISASDDAVHANYGTTLGNSSKGVGNVTISGG